jgi:hypothetical protein
MVIGNYNALGKKRWKCNFYVVEHTKVGTLGSKHIWAIYEAMSLCLVPMFLK